MTDTPGKDDEDALWRHVKQETRPLAKKKRAAPKPKVPPAPSLKKAAPKPKAPPQAASQAAASPAPPQAAAMGSGLDRRSATRLRRGQMAIAATLDLHGQTQAEAHRTLNLTLSRAHRAGKRTVLVITGKGLGKEGGGVLRANVPRWLGEPPLSGIVLDVAPAQGKHGGGGAFYVLLRKPRQSR